MTQIVSLLLAIFKAVPQLKQWWDQLLALYIDNAISDIHENDLKAIKKAIYDQDQRDLEKQVGSTVAGKPSDLPNTEFRDSLPGVVQAEKK